MPEWLIPLILTVGTIVTLWTALGKRADRVETRLGKRIECAEGRIGDRLGRVESRLLAAGALCCRSEMSLPAGVPITLTPLGEKVALDMRADAWAKLVATQSGSQARTRNFEIQEFAFE